MPKNPVRVRLTGRYHQMFALPCLTNAAWGTGESELIRYLRLKDWGHSVEKEHCVRTAPYDRISMPWTDYGTLDRWSHDGI